MSTAPHSDTPASRDAGMPAPSQPRHAGLSATRQSDMTTCPHPGPIGSSQRRHARDAPLAPPRPVKTVSDDRAKGAGRGKTTLSLSLACAAAAEGLSAVVVDLDPQASAASWGATGAGPTPRPSCPRKPRALRASSTRRQARALRSPSSTPRPAPGRARSPPPGPRIWCSYRAAPPSTTWRRSPAPATLVAAVAPATPVLCVLNAVPPRGPPGRGRRARCSPTSASRVAAPSLGQRAAVDYAAAAGQSAAEHDPRGRAAAEGRRALRRRRRTHRPDAGPPRVPR